MTKIKGHGVSSGIAIAHIHHFKFTNISSFKQYASDKAFEVKRLENALKLAYAELEKLVQQAESKIGVEHAEIF